METQSTYFQPPVPLVMILACGNSVPPTHRLSRAEPSETTGVHEEAAQGERGGGGGRHLHPSVLEALLEVAEDLVQDRVVHAERDAMRVLAAVVEPVDAVVERRHGSLADVP